MKLMRAGFSALTLCFVLSLSAAVAAASPWQSTESVDRFNDEFTHRITLWDIAEDGWFSVSCSSRGGRRTSFGWVAPNHRLIGTDVPVEWRLGDRPRGWVQWHSIPDGNLVWDGFSAHRLIDDLLEGELVSTRLIVRSRGNLLEFDITGFSDAYEDLTARCEA